MRLCPFSFCLVRDMSIQKQDKVSLKEDYKAPVATTHKRPIWSPGKNAIATVLMSSQEEF